MTGSWPDEVSGVVNQNGTRTTFMMGRRIEDGVVGDIAEFLSVQVTQAIQNAANGAVLEVMTTLHTEVNQDVSDVYADFRLDLLAAMYGKDVLIARAVGGLDGALGRIAYDAIAVSLLAMQSRALGQPIPGVIKSAMQQARRASECDVEELRVESEAMVFEGDFNDLMRDVVGDALDVTVYKTSNQSVDRRVFSGPPAALRLLTAFDATPLLRPTESHPVAEVEAAVRHLTAEDMHLIGREWHVRER